MRFIQLVFVSIRCAPKKTMIFLRIKRHTLIKLQKGTIRQQTDPKCLCKTATFKRVVKEGVILIELLPFRTSQQPWLVINSFNFSFINFRLRTEHSQMMPTDHPSDLSSVKFLMSRSTFWLNLLIY